MNNELNPIIDNLNDELKNLLILNGLNLNNINIIANILSDTENLSIEEIKTKYNLV